MVSMNWRPIQGVFLDFFMGYYINMIIKMIVGLLLVHTNKDL